MYGVLKGSHRINELCFQEQLKLGGPLGPGSPNWPLKDNVSYGFFHYPPSLQEYYLKHEAKPSFNRQFDLDPRQYAKDKGSSAKTGNSELAKNFCLALYQGLL